MFEEHVGIKWDDGSGCSTKVYETFYTAQRIALGGGTRRLATGCVMIMRYDIGGV